MKVFEVYKTTNLLTGQYYIGSHRSKPDDRYLGSGSELRKALIEHGRSNFKREVLGVFENKLDALKAENELISASLSDPLCYNKPPNRKKSLCPLPVQKALKDLGRDIKNARLRRRIQTFVMAERCSISRPTLVNIEKGLPSVALGAFVKVLFSLGLLDKLSLLAGVSGDEVGLALQEETLPKRIRK